MMPTKAGNRYKKLRRWIGRRVRGWYPAPAITCEMNGGRCHYEGTIVGIGKHRYIGPSLKLSFEDDKTSDIYVHPEEFTHRHDGKCWRRINPEREE